MNQPPEEPGQNQIRLVLTRSPFGLVAIGVTALVFTLIYFADRLGTAQTEPGQNRNLLLVLLLVLLAVASFEVIALRNQRLEMDQNGVRVWDWRGRLLLEAPLADIKELRVSLQGEGGSVWLITRRGDARITGIGGLYDLGSALRKLGTVKVDEKC